MRHLNLLSPTKKLQRYDHSSLSSSAGSIIGLNGRMQADSAEIWGVSLWRFNDRAFKLAGEAYDVEKITRFWKTKGIPKSIFLSFEDGLYAELYRIVCIYTLHQNCYSSHHAFIWSQLKHPISLKWKWSVFIK